MTKKKKPEEATILVADDDYDVRKTLALILKNILNVPAVVEASDGSDAFFALFRYEVDLVMSDWMMPAVSGLELLAQMKKDKDLKKIPFILITSEAKPEYVDKATRAGVDDYIVKPFTTDVIIERVSNILG